MDNNLIIKYKAILKEINARKGAEKLCKYNTGEKVHFKQMEFHCSQKRNRWVFGGNRSGKSECGAVEAIWLARGIHPCRQNRANISGWVVSLSHEVQRDVAQEKFLSYLSSAWVEDVVMLSGKKDNPMYGVVDYILIKNVFGGVSKIAFKSCDQGREKFQGASLDFVWFDEEPPQSIYEECKMRVLDKCGDLWGTMTPLKGLTWVYDEIFLNTKSDSEVWHIQMEWADNPFLVNTEVERLTLSLSKDSLDARRYGRFCEAEGLVYKEFDESYHTIEPFDVPFEWQDNIAIDPGLNNPLACLFFAVDFDGNIFVVGEHYQSGQGIDFHTEKINELACRLNWHRDSKGRLTALIDSAATQRTLASTKSVVELFYDSNIIVNPKVNKELFSGISRVKQYFTKGCGNKIYIFRTCTNLIRELKTYWWGDGDVPKKKDDHALDALRYYIMSKPIAKTKILEESNAIKQDKEKLIKQLRLENKKQYR